MVFLRRLACTVVEEKSSSMTSVFRSRRCKIYRDRYYSLVRVSISFRGMLTTTLRKKKTS